MINFLEFYAAVKAWKKICQESRGKDFPNWRTNVGDLLDEAYEPLEGSLFGDAVLKRRNK